MKNLLSRLDAAYGRDPDPDAIARCVGTSAPETIKAEELTEELRKSIPENARYIVQVGSLTPSYFCAPMKGTTPHIEKAYRYSMNELSRTRVHRGHTLIRA